MKSQFAVSILQTTLEWEDAAKNRIYIESLLDEETNDSDLIVLPEMFTTGFTMNAAIQAEKMDGPTIKWMQDLSVKKSSDITGSLIIQEDENYFNRLVYVKKTGEMSHYDKRHLFSFANEHLHFSPGNKRLIIESEGWRICPMICYDLRFPVWSRNASLRANDDENVYDLLIYVANWPEVRRQPWMNLLEARAHENQCYVVGVNRVGIDGKGISYTGDSAIYSPKGESLFKAAPNQITVKTIVLEKSLLEDFRQKFPVGKDKDQFKVDI